VVVVVVAFVVLTDVLLVGCVSDFAVVALVATAVFVDVIEVAGPLLQLAAVQPIMKTAVTIKQIDNETCLFLNM
jgi:uncharacterized protein YcfJ